MIDCPRVGAFPSLGESSYKVSALKNTLIRYRFLFRRSTYRISIPGPVFFFLYLAKYKNRIEVYLRGKSVRSWCGGSSDRSFMVDPLSYFSFQPVPHDWFNWGGGGGGYLNA